MKLTWRDTRGALLLATATAALALGGCRQDMHDQPRFDPLEETTLFGNGSSARELVEGTVARGHLAEDAAFETGLAADGSFAAGFPMPVDIALLERGQSRYEAFCTPCHDRVGNGRGMIVRRGYKQPNSFHDQRLREAQPGYFVNVITNGFGQMSSYAPQIRAADRWAIAAYIRALQVSQRAPASALDEDDLEALASGLGASPSAAAGEAADGGHS